MFVSVTGGDAATRDRHIPTLGQGGDAVRKNRALDANPKHTVLALAPPATTLSRQQRGDDKVAEWVVVPIAGDGKAAGVSRQIITLATGGASKRGTLS